MTTIKLKIDKEEFKKKLGMETKVINHILPAEKADVLRDKLESLEGDERIDAKAIKNLPKPIINSGGIQRIDQALDTNIEAPTDGQTLTYDADTGQWVNSDGTPGGGGTWGSITGTLSDQEDLQLALDSKADDADVVHKTGAESIAGIKEFTSGIDLSGTPYIRGKDGGNILMFVTPQVTTDTPGGQIQIGAGDGNGIADGGGLQFVSGNADGAGEGQGGAVSIQVGGSSGDSDGNRVYIIAGSAGGLGDGGEVDINGGSINSGGEGDGGVVKLTGGNSSNEPGSRGGNIELSGGISQGGTAENGGDIILKGGLGDSPGLPGAVKLVSPLAPTFSVILDVETNVPTGDNVITFPNSSGTLAFTSQIPDTSLFFDRIYTVLSSSLTAGSIPNTDYIYEIPDVSYVLTLENANSVGDNIYYIKNTSAGTVTIGTSSSNTFDGVAAPYSLPVGEAIVIHANGFTDWKILAAYSLSSGGSLAEEFETVSKNLKSYPYDITYDVDDNIDFIDYDTGSGTITKTFGYTSGDVTSIVLSGSTPGGINLTKTLTYSSGNITNVTYA